MSDTDKRPKLDRARHALLFELIRQRGMAHSVSHRHISQPETDPSALHLFVQAASHSIAPEDGKTH